MDQQELPGHNRWHPDIPAVVSVNPGDVFRIECKDWTDGQIQNNDDPKDIEEVDLTVVHVLSGPIWVNGAQPGDILVVDLLDIGALQGDGEISFCGAIEMSGYIDLHVDIIKGGVDKYSMVNPIFKPGPVEPRYSEYLVFEGISVDELTGKQYFMDVHIAYRQACLNAINYLKKFGFTGEQAYLLLSCAPIEGRVSGIVDIPNACCTVAIPTEIFNQPILPV